MELSLLNSSVSFDYYRRVSAAITPLWMALLRFLLGFSSVLQHYKALFLYTYATYTLDYKI